MAIRRMRIYGDPVLRQKAAPVTEFDDSLREFVADLYETMVAYDGMGLAAPQVGVSQRVFVVEVPVGESGTERITAVNPEILDRSGKDGMEEGCLSIPYVRAEVTRATRLRLRAFDEHGRPFERELEDLAARAIQHEMDHLEGVFFTDRVSPLKRQFLRRELDALARGEVPEGYHPASATEDR